MYGAPPNIRAVIGLFEEKAEQERWQQYMASMAWGMVKAIKPKANLPMYKVKGKETHDSRTGKEILEEVREKVRRHRAAREVKKQNETV